MHLGALLSPILPKSKETETIPEVKKQDIFSNRIWKKGLDKNLDNFLRIPQKILNKKRQLIKASKQKESMNKQKSETVIINSFNNSDIESLLILIRVSTLGIKKVDVAIIDIVAYPTTCQLKKAQVFAISIRDLE